MKNLPFALFLAAAASGQTTAPVLVDSAWLTAHLHDPNLVLLQVGTKEDYAAKHIPGARAMTMNDVIRPMSHDRGDVEIMVELPDAATLRAKLESFGISDSSRVVLYFASDKVVSATTRVLFTFDYIGLGDRTSLLDGGLPAWVASGKPVNTDVPPSVARARRGSISWPAGKPSHGATDARPATA